MWTPLRAEVSSRFAAVEAFFDATRDFKGTFGQTAKGLAFIQIYAAYEYTVRAVVRTAVGAITAYNHRADELIPSLMALFLDQELSSLRDCPNPRVWEKRIELFEAIFAGVPAHVHNTVFPVDGSHFRHDQLQTIFDVLGIRRMPAQRRRHLIRIDEVVGHRNDIAHGSVTADAVGKRYSRGEVRHIIRQVRSVCLLLISAVERQCSDVRRHCRP